jgi:hypothetical protein
MKVAGPLAFILLMVGPSVAAHADMDYHCLTMCVKNGDPKEGCMKTCSYNLPSPPPDANAGKTARPGAPQKPQSHKVLQAPVPFGGQILAKSKTKTAPVTTDYACLSHCLKNNMQYPLCRDGCSAPSSGSSVLSASGKSHALPDFMTRADRNPQSAK